MLRFTDVAASPGATLALDPINNFFTAADGSVIPASGSTGGEITVAPSVKSAPRPSPERPAGSPGPSLALNDVVAAPGSIATLGLTYVSDGVTTAAQGDIFFDETQVTPQPCEIQILGERGVNCIRPGPGVLRWYTNSFAPLTDPIPNGLLRFSFAVNTDFSTDSTVVLEVENGFFTDATGTQIAPGETTNGSISAPAPGILNVQPPTLDLMTEFAVEGAGSITISNDGVLTDSPIDVECSLSSADPQISVPPLSFPNLNPGQSVMVTATCLPDAVGTFSAEYACSATNDLTTQPLVTNERSVIACDVAVGTQGALQGAISDRFTSEPIAGATVDTGSGAAATSNDVGTYFLPAAMADRDTATVDADGYFTERFSFEISSGEITVKDIEMEPGLFRDGFEDIQFPLQED